jgi:hypothetical protein
MPIKRKKVIAKLCTTKPAGQNKNGDWGGGVVCTEKKGDEIAPVLEASPIMIIVMTMQLWLCIFL